MNKPLFLVGGCKGGVGKSLVSLSLVDYLRERGESVLLVETDTSNPDVWRMHAEEAGIEAYTLDLDQAEGWIDLANIGDAHPERTIVVNTAARNHRGVAAHGATLREALSELERRWVTLWVINRDRDSLELLEDYLRTLNEARLHVVCNTFFGLPEQFELYRVVWADRIAAMGGQTLVLPRLAARVSGDLYSRRWSIARALRKAPPGAPPDTGLPIGNRVELNRWRKEVSRMYDAAIPSELAAGALE